MDACGLVAALLIDAAVLGVGVCCLTKTIQLKKIMENFHRKFNISKRSGDMFLFSKIMDLAKQSKFRSNLAAHEGFQFSVEF